MAGDWLAKTEAIGIVNRKANTRVASLARGGFKMPRVDSAMEIPSDRQLRAFAATLTE
jgi:hypothetical protein